MLLGIAGLLLFNSPSLRGDMVDLQLEYNSSTLAWELHAQVVITGSGSSGTHGLAAVRALIDNVPLAGVTLAGDIGAIDPIDLGGPNERSAIVATFGGTIDIIYLQNLAAPATVVEGVGVGGRHLIASGSYLDIAAPPSFGDDDFGYQSDGNFLNRLGPGSYGPAFPWDDVSLTVTDVSPQGISGDYNDDGVVDARDYIVWRNHLGAPAGSLVNDPHATAIGTAQYLTWKENFGLSLPPGGLAFHAVPEPRAALILAVALLAIRKRPRTKSPPPLDSCENTRDSGHDMATSAIQLHFPAGGAIGIDLRWQNQETGRYVDGQAIAAGASRSWGWANASLSGDSWFVGAVVNRVSNHPTCLRLVGRAADVGTRRV